MVLIFYVVRVCWKILVEHFEVVSLDQVLRDGGEPEEDLEPALVFLVLLLLVQQVFDQLLKVLEADKLFEDKLLTDVILALCNIFLGQDNRSDGLASCNHSLVKK